MNVSFRTELSIEECKERIGAIIEEGKRGGVSGRMRAASNTFWMRNDGFWNYNSYRRVVYGKITETQNGSTVNVNFVLIKPVKFFIICSYIFVTFVTIMCLRSLIFNIVKGESTKIIDGVIGLLMSLGCIALLVVIPFFARWLDGGNDEEILDLLYGALEAKKIEPEH